jgi:guanylate kinase
MKPIIVLCGKSGSGKDYLSTCFNLRRNIGNTTRQPREGETNYNYYSKDYYEHSLNYDTIVTPTYYVNNYYWVWLSDFESKDSDYTVANFEGVRSLVNDIRSGKIKRNVKFIYVECSLYRRIKNMRKRKDSFKNIFKRLRADRIEFKGAKDFILNNKGYLIKI